MSPLPEFCFGKLQHEVRVKTLIDWSAANLRQYDLGQNWDLWCHIFMEKICYLGEIFLFAFAYLTTLRKKLGQLKKKKNRKRSIDILQSAKGKSRDILAHSFTLKTVYL